MPNYAEGRAAFHRGVPSEHSPYADAERRILWVKGWYDSKHDYKEALARLAANLPLRRVEHNGTYKFAPPGNKAA